MGVERCIKISIMHQHQNRINAGASKEQIDAFIIRHHGISAYQHENALA